MPRDAKTPGLDAGERAEVRVAEAWFWEGDYVRRGVDLQHRFKDEISSVTDLDVLGFTFDASLACHKHIGEVKTGNSKSTPRPLDRALWMHGLRQLVGAERSEVTTAFRVSPAIRDICRRLGSTIQHLDDLAAREQRLGIHLVIDTGSQGESIAVLRKEVHAFAKADPTLERAYWFLISEVWFLEPFDALKRTLGLIRELSKTWPPEANVEATKAARWFFAEAISVATLNLTTIAGEANTVDSATFHEMAMARLASGDVPYFAQRKLAERVDEYVAKLLASVDAPAVVRTGAMGAFLPTPPDYAEPLLELVSRLAAEAATTARLPRQLDAVLFERLVRRRDLTPELRRRLQITGSTERQMRLVAAFLRGQFSIPAAVEKVLSSPLVLERLEAAESSQATLFEPEITAKDSGSESDSP